MRCKYRDISLCPGSWAAFKEREFESEGTVLIGAGPFFINIEGRYYILLLTIYLYSNSPCYYRKNGPGNDNRELSIGCAGQSVDDQPSGVMINLISTYQY